RRPVSGSSRRKLSPGALSITWKGDRRAEVNSRLLKDRQNREPVDGGTKFHVGLSVFGYQPATVKALENGSWIIFDSFCQSQSGQSTVVQMILSFLIKQTVKHQAG